MEVVRSLHTLYTLPRLCHRRCRRLFHTRTTQDLKYAIVFPGQGTQHVGMGMDLWQTSTVAKQVFDEADEALGFSLSKLMREGPEVGDALTLD